MVYILYTNSEMQWTFDTVFFIPPGMIIHNIYKLVCAPRLQAEEMEQETLSYYVNMSQILMRHISWEVLFVVNSIIYRLKALFSILNNKLKCRWLSELPHHNMTHDVLHGGNYHVVHSFWMSMYLLHSDLPCLYGRADGGGHVQHAIFDGGSNPSLPN